MERTTTLWVWFSLMILLGISISGGLCEGQQHLMKKTRSSAVVVGTVYCDTCFNGAFSKSSNHLIPGALVAVECIDEKSKPSFRQEVKTDKRGEFKVKLPFSVSKHVKKIKRCSVKLLSSSQPYCSIASSATSSSLKRLKSNHHENTRIFSAGFFTFKPENQPEICSQKPSTSKPLLPDPSFPPPIKDPPNPSPLPNLPIVPPLPELPVPQLPPLLPGGPQKAAPLHSKKSGSLNDKKTEVLKPDFFFPPNPLNPPSVIPPNPLIPSIPTPTLPPNPVIPSPPSLPPIPLIPSPSAPTLPPLPLVPTPSAPTLPPLPLVPSPSVPTLPPLPIPLPPVPVVNPPSLPPPPSFPVPLPPLPGVPPLPGLPGLPPLPGVPGGPPASPSFSSHHQP